MWRWIDEKQLNGWQFVANHLNWKTGIGQFTAARACVVAYAAAGLAYFWQVYRLGPKDDVKTYALVAFFCLLFVPFGFMMAWVAESRVRKGTFKNPEQELWASRLNRAIQTFIASETIVTCILVRQGVRSLDVAYVAMWAFVYLIACDMPPPKPVDETTHDMAPSTA